VSDQTDPFLEYDAAYVMGALDPADRRAFEAHLATCPQCSAAVAELAGMPGLLAQLSTAEVLAPRATPEPVPDTLLPRLGQAMRAHRRRRRLLGSLAGVVAAACLALAIVLTSGVLHSDSDAPSVARGSHQGTTQGSSSQTSDLVMTAPESGSVLSLSAAITLDPVAWGTKVNIQCTYAETVPEPAEDLPTYRVFVLPRDGGRAEQVASWTALAGRTVTLNGSTNLKPAQIADIRLEDSRGVTLLHATPKV
jgi:hypothetical protein